ncbi:hypothetical protein NP233_g1260 [Leucocoprinus birnbaumii]|uniref:Uncharacterized protein n=1 Tax=Leucocoprinus birnbaumii TaxID=56174 RepID=A0AAD5W082_9AGAR|nr:hypothetical protein NP233_g1260 [Leucocoprinus birnbaumii]
MAPTDAPDEMIMISSSQDILHAWMFWRPETPRRVLSTILFRRTTACNATLTIITEPSRPRQGSIASVKAWMKGRPLSAPSPISEKVTEAKSRSRSCSQPVP